MVLLKIAASLVLTFFFIYLADAHNSWDFLNFFAIFPTLYAGYLMMGGGESEEESRTARRSLIGMVAVAVVLSLFMGSGSPILVGIAVAALILIWLFNFFAGGGGGGSDDDGMGMAANAQWHQRD